MDREEKEKERRKEGSEGRGGEEIRRFFFGREGK